MNEHSEDYTMKSLITVFLAFSLLITMPATSRAGAGDFRFSRLDHQAHIAVSYSLTLTATLICQKKAGMSRTKAVLISALAVLLMGGLKELASDEPGESSDMVANTIGIGAAAGMAFALRF